MECKDATEKTEAQAHSMQTTCGCGHTEAKWAVLVDDGVVHMPGRTVNVAVIRAQGGTPEEMVLVRDHNSPQDTVLNDSGSVDLAEGNVFYTMPRCEVQPNVACNTPPKLAFFVNDVAEIVTRAAQTGATVRDLFGLARNAHLTRDLEGAQDTDIGLDEPAHFEDGPVFYSRVHESVLKIVVNSRVFTERDGVAPHMTGLAIATLVFQEKPSETTVRLLTGGERVISHEEVVEIVTCMEFSVTRKKVEGGFEASRVNRELEVLREGGASVTLIESPVHAVLYQGLRAYVDGREVITDVLVPVPSGYPGNMLDWVYLPENSPLMGKLPGSPQDPRLSALGVTWRQVSYHPHNGGGAPPWNPTVHGFHTYLGEVLSWLSSGQ